MNYTTLSVWVVGYAWEIRRRLIERRVPFKGSTRVLVGSTETFQLFSSGCPFGVGLNTCFEASPLRQIQRFEVQEVDPATLVVRGSMMLLTMPKDGRALKNSGRVAVRFGGSPSFGFSRDKRRSHPVLGNPPMVPCCGT